MEDDKLEKNEQSEAIDEGQEQDSGKQKPEEEQAQEGEQEGAEQQEENSEAEKPSPRRDKRIKELLDRLHEKDEPPEKKTGLNYRDALEADDDTITKLEQDREAYGKSLYEEGLQRANSIQFHTRLELDVPKIESRYPQLDPHSADFDADTLSDINELYLHLSGYDTKTGNVKTANLRYADFVEHQMEMADRLASKRHAESSKNIARQAAQTGIRPNGAAAKTMDLSKDPSQMTDEELDAVINQAIPPKTRRR